MTIALALLVNSRKSYATPSDTVAGVINLYESRVTSLKSHRAVASPGLVNSAAKGMWMENWSQPGQSFVWTVYAPQRGAYQVTLLVAAKGGSRIVVDSGVDSIEAVVPEGDDYWGENWQRFSLPRSLIVDGGETKVQVTRLGLSGMPGQKHAKGAALLGMELLPAGQVAAHVAKVKGQRADVSWMGAATYGLMLQWGEWSVPRQGNKAVWPAQIDAFDVNRFADMAMRAGAGYVIWSATWRSHYFPAPIKAIDEILPGRTCRRDLIMELAHALRARGIRLILYYNGITDDKEWQDRIGFVRNDTGEMASTRYEENWLKIVTEVGLRYGDLLAGWMIDEAIYPRDFDHMSTALKSGHRSRLVSINAWIRCRLTDYQDFYLGEGVDLRKPPEQQAQYLATIDPSTGRFARGPQAGLQAHGCFLLDTQSTLTDWAIWQPNAAITEPLISEDDIRQMARVAVTHKHALSFNIMMYEDGGVSALALSRLELMKQCVSHEKALLKVDANQEVSGAR
jgi:hypothetical protein